MVLGQSLIVILTALTVSICSDPDVDPQILYTTEAFYTPLLLNRTGWSFGGVPVTQLEVMPSLSGHADLLNWMFYFRRPNSPIGFIYGTPPLNDDGDIDIDLVILNRVTFNTTSYRLKYRILNRDGESSSYYMANSLTHLLLSLIVRDLQVSSGDEIL